jgi:hypothetical protein
MVPLLAGVTLAAIALIAGGKTPAVLGALTHGFWTVLVLIAAALAGLGLTGPIRHSAAIRQSAWPDAYRFILALALGLGALSLATLALGSLHLLVAPTAAGLLLAAAAAGYPAARRWWRARDRRPWLAPLRRGDWLLLAAALPLAALLTAASFPPGTLWHTEGFGYDVLEYHLQLPRQFLAAHGTAPVHGNIYSFLPLNVEMLYLLLDATVRPRAGGRGLEALIYGAQLLHAVLTVLSALAVALAPWPLGPRGRRAALLLALATPWVIVVGSLAYNDAGVLLYGALALGVAAPGWSRTAPGLVEGAPGVKTPPKTAPAGAQRHAAGDFPCSGGWTEALLLGVLTGLAVGCKMTAGVMIAVPLAVLLVLRPVPRRFRHRLTALLVVTLAATAVYSPWMLRSMVATHTRTSLGNPIFPLFAGTLGRDHWSKALAKRFDRGHRPPANEASLEGHLGALANQFFLDRQWSPGVAAYIDALANPPGFPSPNLPWPWRLGLLWLVCLPALVLAITSRPASLLLAVLAVQLLAWLSCTQLQARFLLPAIIPMAWLLGLAADRYGGLGRISLLVLLAQAGFCALLLRPEAGLFLGPIRGAAIAPIGRRFHWPRDWLVGRHPVVRFPTHATYYLEGLATPLYLRGRVIYNTVFNRNRLGRVLARGGPAAAVRWLEKRGVNFLILDWPEVRRLRATYGFNSAVTPAAIAAMQRAGLPPLKAPTIPGIQIFRVSGQPQRNSERPRASNRPRDDPAPRAVWPPTAPTDR